LASPTLSQFPTSQSLQPPTVRRNLEIASYWLMLAESHLTRRLFGSMVRRIGALAVATE